MSALVYSLGCLFCAVAGFALGLIYGRVATEDKKGAAVIAIPLILDRLRNETDSDIILQLEDRLAKCLQMQGRVTHD